MAPSPSPPPLLAASSPLVLNPSPSCVDSKPLNATLDTEQPPKPPKEDAGQSIAKITEPPDWPGLRDLSLRPGGFGAERVQLWPKLLGVVTAGSGDIPKQHDAEETPHRDERQIRLDTDRSFVLYPAGASSDSKDTMQESLHTLTVSVFRRCPKLNYFQGYHDIISVLFLTLPPSLQLVCAEQLSLQRVRDSMGATLEPVLGLLRVSKNLLRLADPHYAASLERTSPLPFYALSNLLTLFSHDMPTLPLIQHVFDWLLCRPPIAVVYLSISIVLEHKDEILRLEREERESGEDGEGMGMAHSLLSGLPDLVDSEEEAPNTENMAVKKEPMDVKREDETVYEAKVIGDMKKEGQGSKMDEDTKFINGDKVEQDACGPPPARIEEAQEILAEQERRTFVHKLEDTHEEHNLNSESSDDMLDLLGEHHEEQGPRDAPTKTSPSESSPVLSKRTTLTSLLKRADALNSLYPPTHPELHLSSIMGPQSVVHTWSEDFTALPGNEEAEAMVAHPGLVVYPYIEDEEEEDEEGWVDGGQGSKDSIEEKKSNKGKRRIWGRSGEKGKGKDKRPPRKLRKPRRMLESRTVVVSAVLVLSVAMAVYGTRGHMTEASRRGLFRLDIRAGLEAGREWRGVTFKKISGWIGDIVLGR